MDDKQFEKRIELLKKSYDRMEPQLDPKTVFAQIEAEDAAQQSQETVTTQKPPSRWQKPAVWIACIASVLLVGVLVSSYVINPLTFVQTAEQEQAKEQEKVYEEWLSNFTKEYKEKREQMRKELDIPEKEFSEISLVQTTDNEVDSLPKRKELFQDVQNRNDNFLNSLAKNTLDNLQTPREQIQLIETYGNLMSFEESYFFYSGYSYSAEEIANYYSNKLVQYEKVLSQKPKSLPADLNKLIATAKEQYLELQYNGQSYSFRPNPVFGKDAPEYIERLHPNVLGYFKYLATGSLLVGGDLLYSIEDSATVLRLYEKTLVADKSTETDNFNVLKGEFENTWLAIFKGTETNPIRTKTGQYKPEYIDLLTIIANGGYGEAMRKTAQSILDEIKVTGQSKTLEQLTTYDIWMGILYLREDTFMQTDDGTTSMEINEGWIEQTKSLYDEYVKTKNDAIIETLNPFNIVSLFLYAHGVGDRDIAQRLLTDDLDINTVVQFGGMDNFKALYEMGGSSLSIRAIVKGAAQGVVGQQLSFELTPVVTENGEQHYRISAINE
ncbi:hypothetical protein B1B04_11150 [Lysinibacillus sp. KCTC 33748]|uniref:hypothetical protein n=1 Tax=unclassified Lysinibacillus TaxID=2636778 RepID=UPI0009A70D26|nr:MULTISPECIES: hypothetical protein [unclassified Lysinibacillus]OXS74174.1 hypothetical protein B1B04_11150 [Lysinibacillus sp. KCTC 33748]SKB72454.1 hypothetical protein SAMN06295926_106198 [Lysinibacillus sp. AC-3]